VANANKVEKNIRRALRKSAAGRLEAGSLDGLKELIGAAGMCTSRLFALLESMRHHRELRAFNLQNSNAYIQA
jgi:hypothetical protein